MWVLRPAYKDVEVTDLARRTECGFIALHQPTQCSLTNVNNFLEVVTKFIPLSFVIRLQGPQQLWSVGMHWESLHRTLQTVF